MYDCFGPHRNRRTNPGSAPSADTSHSPIRKLYGAKGLSALPRCAATSDEAAKRARQHWTTRKPWREERRLPSIESAPRRGSIYPTSVTRRPEAGRTPFALGPLPLSENAWSITDPRAAHRPRRIPTGTEHVGERHLPRATS